MNNESRLALIRLHYHAWLTSVGFSSLEDAIASKSKTRRGLDVIERHVVFYVSGCSLRVLKALQAGDLEALESSCEDFKSTFGDEALQDGTYTLSPFGA